MGGHKKKLTIDLGWETVTLTRRGERSWYLRYLQKLFAFEVTEKRHIWTVIAFEGSLNNTKAWWAARCLYPTLAAAVEAVVREVQERSGEAPASIGARIGWKTRKQRKKKAVADLKRKRRNQAEKARNAKQAKRKAKQLLKEGRPDAPWNF